MTNGETQPVGEVGSITLGDKRSHLMSLWLGCCIGALVSAIIVVATAIAHKGGI